jgi:hypothetical protein
MFPSLPVRNSFLRTNFAYYNPNRRLQPHQLDVGLNSRHVTSGPVSGCRLSCSSSRASSQCVSQRQFPPIDRKLFGGPLRLLTGPVMGVDFVICQVRLLVSRTCFSLPRACFSMDFCSHIYPKNHGRPPGVRQTAVFRSLGEQNPRKTTLGQKKTGPGL